MTMTDPKPLIAHQPLKALYVVVSLLYCLLVRLPVLGLYLSRAANRQDPTWSWAQAIGLSTGKFLFNLGASVRFARVFPINRSLKDPKKALIPAATAEKLDGILLDPKVKPADLMGEWYPAPFAGDDDIKSATKVIVFMFGGAYVMGDSNPANYVATLRQICPALNAKFLIIAYRLAGSAGGQPFPAQLQDLLSAYLYVLRLGIASKNIILAGESAGGNAVISFLRYLEECKPGHILPSPGAALLSSPWVDLTPDPWLRAKDSRYKTDFAAVQLVVWGQQAFIPPDRTVSGRALAEGLTSLLTSGKSSDKYISPALAPFRSNVPIWIEAGTGETVFDLLSRFAQDMEHAGTDIEFHAVPHGTHAHMWSAGMVGFDAAGSVKSFVMFMKKRGH